MLRAGWSILFLFVIACVDARPVRLVAGRSDTVIVHSRASMAMAVRLVDVNGVERRARGVRYQLIAGSYVKLAEDGRVTCDRPGDAEVAVTYRELATRVTVLCRPIEGIRMPRVLRLTIGGAPAPIDVGAIGVDGKPLDMVAATASARDSHVVALAGGYVHARARGYTLVDVEAGDCVMSIPVEVVEWSRTPDGLLPHQLYAESLSVSAGELRSWHVPAGRYEISLLGDGGAPAHLQLASHEMNCAALPGTEQQYSCIAKDRASVIVHHTEPAGRGRGRQSTATLLVHRLGDLASQSAAWRVLQVMGCPWSLR